MVVGDRQDFGNDRRRVRSLRFGLVGVGGAVEAHVGVLGLVLLLLEKKDLLCGGVGPRQDPFLVGATQGPAKQSKKV